MKSCGSPNFECNGNPLPCDVIGKGLDSQPSSQKCINWFNRRSIICAYAHVMASTVEYSYADANIHRVRGRIINHPIGIGKHRPPYN